MMKKASLLFLILINFLSLKYEQGLFLQKLSDALEESKNKIVFQTFFQTIIFGYMVLKELIFENTRNN